MTEYDSTASGTSGKPAEDTPAPVAPLAPAKRWALDPNCYEKFEVAIQTVSTGALNGAPAPDYCLPADHPRYAELEKPGDIQKVAELVHEAMRFEREGETPKWQGGNSFAEDRARMAAHAIADICKPQPAPDYRAALQRAVGALEPFADFGELLDTETEGFADSDNINVTLGAAIFPNFTFGHFRRARAVLAELKALEGR